MFNTYADGFQSSHEDGVRAVFAKGLAEGRKLAEEAAGYIAGVDVTGLQNQIASLADKLSAQAATNATINTQNDDLNAKLVAAQASIAADALTIADLQAQITTLTAQVAALTPAPAPTTEPAPAPVVDPTPAPVQAPPTLMDKVASIFTGTSSNV
jgi:cell division protein FtsB